MRRIIILLVTAVVLGSVAVAGPASAAPKKKPQRGDWSCVDAGEAPLASVHFFKGNKYAVDGGDKAKYVYKAGKKKMKFKNGDFAIYYALYDRETKVLSLFLVEDDSAAGSCTRDEVVDPAPVPEVPEEETPEEPEDPAAA